MTTSSELDQLEDAYRELYASYEQGALSDGDLLSRVEELAVVDSAGYMWKINVTGSVPGSGEPYDGEFIRVSPTGVAEPGYPENFALSQVNGPVAGAFDPFPHSAVDPMRAPSGVVQPQQVSAAAAPPSAPRGAALGGLSERVSDLTNGRGRLILIAVIIIAVIGYLATRSDDSGTETPVEPAPTVTTIEEFDPSGGSGEDPEAAAVPTPDDVSRVVSSLRSGDPETVRDVIVAVPDNEFDFLLNVAAWYGLGEVGVEIKSGPVAPGEKPDVASQVLGAVDAETGDTLGTFEVEWVRGENGWVIATLPTPPSE